MAIETAIKTNLENATKPRLKYRLINSTLPDKELTTDPVGWDKAIRKLTRSITNGGLTSSRSAEPITFIRDGYEHIKQLYDTNETLAVCDLEILKLDTNGQTYTRSGDVYRLDFSSYKQIKYERTTFAVSIVAENTGLQQKFQLNKKKKLDLKSTTSFNQTELEVGNSADYKSADSDFINLNTSMVEAVAVMPQIAYSNGLTEANTVPKAVEVSFAKPSATTDATCNVNACCMYKAASKAVTVTLKGSLMAEFDERFANTWENDTYELIVCKVNAANQQGNAVVLRANTTVLDSKAVSIKLAGGYRFSYNTTVSLTKGQSFFLAIRPTTTDVNRVRFKESNSSAIISTGTSHWANMQKKINIHPMSLYLIGDFEQGVNSNGGFLGDVWGGYLDHYTTLAYDLITSDSTHIKSSQVEYGIFATGATKYMGDIGCIVKQVSETTVIKLQTSFTLTAVEVDYFGNKIVYDPAVHKAKKEVIAMILKNGKIERLITLYTIANDSTLDNIDIDTNITLQNGESLGVALHGEPLSAWPPWFYKITNLTARIKLNAESTQPIEVDGFPIYEALERAAQIALNINYPIYSEFYGRTNISYNANGDKYTTEDTKNFVHLISGLSLRGMPLYSKQNSYNTTLEDMLQMSKAINNTGYGFETIGGREVLRIEHISHFFPEAPTNYIAKAKGVPIEGEVAETLQFSEVQNGFDSYEYLDNNGRAEPCTTVSRSTIIPNTTKYKATSKIRADQRGIMQTINNPVITKTAGKIGSNDTRGDNNLFMIKSQRSSTSSDSMINKDVTLNWIAETDEQFEILEGSSIYDNQTINRALVPSVTIWKHGNYITAGLGKALASNLVFVTSDKQSVLKMKDKVTGQVFDEVGNIPVSSLTKCFYKAFMLKITLHMLSTEYTALMANKTGLIALTPTLQGWIKELEYSETENLITLTLLQKNN